MERRLWVRAGDSDDYNCFPSLGEVAGYLQTLEVDEVSRFGQYGVEGGGFSGKYNYISLFWGDAQAQPSSEAGDLTDTELAELNQLLR